MILVVRLHNCIFSVACAPTGDTLAAGCEGCLQIFEPDSDALLWQILPHHELLPNEECFVAYAPDGKKLAMGCGGCVYIFEVNSGLLCCSMWLTNSVFCLADAPNAGSIAVGCEDACVHIVDTFTGQLLRKELLGRHAGSMPMLSLSYSLRA